MKIFDAISPLRHELSTYKRTHKRIGFVPTMGHLHAGHMSLIELAKVHSKVVVASLFVNPTQFAPGEDYDAYPRDFARDCELLQQAGVDVLFHPKVETMYPPGVVHACQVAVPTLNQDLCGGSRPHFFTAVATVVAKLFNIVMPDVAVFGEKDYQQLQVIRHMVTALSFPIDLIAGPTVRAEDGLALSSRNSYLSEEQRRIAPMLQETLREVIAKLDQGQRDFARLESQAREALVRAGFGLDYVSIRSRPDLQLPDFSHKDFIVLGAATLGETRLIDNAY